MNIVHLLRKDLQIFFRDRGSLFYLFVLPVVFILIFTSLIGATVSEQEGDVEAPTDENAVMLTIVNFDSPGLLSGDLVRLIDESPGYQIRQISEQDAQRELEKYTITEYISIPDDFSAYVAADEPVTLTLVIHPDVNRAHLEGVQRLLASISRDMAMEQRILAGLKQMGAMQAANPQTASAFNQDKLITQARSQFRHSRTYPLISVVQINPKGSVDPGADFNFLMAYVSGFAVLFVFLSAQVTARSLFEEQKSGSFRRLLSAPIHKYELLLGKLIPNFILTLIQMVVIFAFGYFFLPLIGLGKVTVGEHPEAWAVVTIVIALCSTSLGIFIAGLAHTEAQVSGISSGILWVAGILSGSLFPATWMPASLSSLGRIFPHYYANHAYYDVLARGYGLPEVLPLLWALLGFTVLFIVVGLWKFDFE